MKASSMESSGIDSSLTAISVRLSIPVCNMLLQKPGACLGSMTLKVLPETST